MDAEGYRSRRDTNLAGMARKLGKQALELGKIITFEPMNLATAAWFMALAKFEGVITKSDGEGDDRRADHPGPPLIASIALRRSESQVLAAEQQRTENGTPR